MIQDYKHIFFDIDGVLLSSTHYYANLFKEVAEELGAEKNLPFSFYHEKIGYGFQFWMPSIIPEENHLKIRPLVELKNKDQSEIHHFPVIDGAEEFLRKLKQENKNIAFISTKSRPGINFILEELKWEKLVDFSVSGDEVVHFKPDPEGLFRTLDYFQADPKHSIFIGDSLHDLGAAKNASVPFLGVLTGVCTQQDWKKEGVKFVESVKELLI